MSDRITTIEVDHLGVVTAPTGESWLVMGEKVAYSLTPPFPKVAVSLRARGVNVQLDNLLNLKLFTKATMAAEWVAKHSETLLKLSWLLPIPYLSRKPPVIYIHSASQDQTRELLEAFERLSVCNPGSQTYSRFWVDGPNRVKLPRVQAINMAPVICWGLISDDQEAMRALEREERKIPLVWVSEDPYLIKSREGLRVPAEEFLQLAGQLLSDPDFNPYLPLRFWAIQRFEHTQFGLPRRGGWLDHD